MNNTLEYNFQSQHQQTKNKQQQEQIVNPRIQEQWSGVIGLDLFYVVFYAFKVFF